MGIELSLFLRDECFSLKIGLEEMLEKWFQNRRNLGSDNKVSE